jgi:hypothetical protein
MPNGISFDSLGRITIHDQELGQQIIDWLQQGNDVSLRVPFPSGTPPPEPLSEVIGTQPVVVLRPVPAPIPMLNGCPNSMCDCPIFRIKKPGEGVLGVGPDGGGLMS